MSKYDLSNIEFDCFNHLNDSVKFLLEDIISSLISISRSSQNSLYLHNKQSLVGDSLDLSLSTTTTTSSSSSSVSASASTTIS
jgi:hypothetical protein